MFCGLFMSPLNSFTQHAKSYQSPDHQETHKDLFTNSNYKLGTLSAKWESGNRGPATISTSIHDPGGTSYGTYQISTKHGYITDFLKYEGAQFCEYFEAFKPGTADFDKQWKHIAHANPNAFHQAEHSFIKRTHFLPFIRRLENNVQFNVLEFSPVIQDVIWSTAVQHGPNSQIINNAFRSVPIHNLSEHDIIKTIYAERSKMRGDKLYYFPRIKDNWKNHLTNRFYEERNEALYQLSKFNAAKVGTNPKVKDNKTKEIPIKDQRFRILLLTLDHPDYPFDDLTDSTVYTEWDEEFGFYNYYVGKYLNKIVADQLLKMLKSKGYQVGQIIKHK